MQRLESLKSKGFVNYFGMQRFGTQSVPTHAVGLAMLSGDLAAAVDLILMPRKSLDSKKQRDYGFREVCDGAVNCFLVLGLKPPALTTHFSWPLCNRPLRPRVRQRMPMPRPCHSSLLNGPCLKCWPWHQSKSMHLVLKGARASLSPHPPHFWPYCSRQQ